MDLKPTYLSILIFLWLTAPISGQYQFDVKYNIDCTGVKSQGRTGTCWSFSTVSFLESELMRMGKAELDLSEMFIVRSIYLDKARNYVLRQGKANFSQGALNHDALRAFRQSGIIPESIYSGKLEGENFHDHGELEAALKGMLDGLLTRKRLSPHWPEAVSCMLDVYLGAIPETFVYKGRTYTPKSFAETLGIRPSDYVTLTSFSHHPFYEEFILEIPDNYSNGQYYNLPLDELQAVADHAIEKGYTVAWDGDVSEQAFEAGKGVALVPADPKRSDLFEVPGAEVVVDQDNRQSAFESFSTTDDHLMHLTGIATDQDGTKYYLTKNSWGAISPYKGFLYMSSSYFRMKTVGIMVHKDAIPRRIAEKISL